MVPSAQHDGDADEQVADGAVAQPPGAGGVRADDAAERAALLGRVQREHLARARPAPAAGPSSRTPASAMTTRSPAVCSTTRSSPSRSTARSHEVGGAAQPSLGAPAERDHGPAGAAQHVARPPRPMSVGRPRAASRRRRRRRRCRAGARSGSARQNTSPSAGSWRVGGGADTRALAAQPRRGEELAGVGDAVRVEGAAHQLHGVEVLGGELVRHLGLLLHADPVLTGDRAAGVDAQLRIAKPSCSASCGRSGHRVVEQDQRVQVAVAGVEDVRDAHATPRPPAGRSPRAPRAAGCAG